MVDTILVVPPVHMVYRKRLSLFQLKVSYNVTVLYCRIIILSMFQKIFTFNYVLGVKVFVYLDDVENYKDEEVLLSNSLLEYYTSASNCVATSSSKASTESHNTMFLMKS